MPPISPRINKVLLLITLLAIGFAGFAQAPNLLNYQGVARNAVGNPLPNQTMTLRVSIRNNSFAGPVVYTETRTVQTNLGGLFAVQLGSAGAISSVGTIAGVNWQVGLKFLQVEVDPKADNHFLDMGTEQLLSVPYAFNGISVEQANAIIANTAKVGITPAQATAIVVNSAKVGISIAQADAIVANTAKVGITPAQATAIVVNSAKVGITTAQADAIVANTAKVGISPAQASAIVVNSAKVGITTAQADMIIANQNALNLKANLASPSFTGTVTIPTLIAGSNTFPSNRGSVNQILTTDGSGTLSWASSGVPYTGATGVVNLGAFDLTVNGLKVGKGAGTNSQNTALGNASLGLNTTGTVNSAVGFESLKSNTTGAANTAFGAYALLENQTGARNTAVGSQALQLTNSAYDNTAIGNLTAVANTSGSYNTAVGSNSLLSNTAGRDNTSVGYEALRFNQANGNTASGYQSMRQNIGGGRNTALGYTALYSNTTASYNVAVGAQALGGATSGERNVAIGAGALDANVTGSYNTVLGGFAGRYFADGLSTVDFGEPANGPHMNSKIDNSILIGAWSKPNNINQTNQIVIGYNAIGNGSNTIQLGNSGITNVKTSGTLTAGTITYPNTAGTNGYYLKTDGSGTASWAVGAGVPYSGATGVVDLGAFDLTVNGLKVGKGAGNIAENTALGNASLGLNTTGAVNSAVGYFALKNNTTGEANTAFGSYALLENQTGARNTAVGSQALQLTKGYDNTAIGNLSAVANINGYNNVAVGSKSLVSNIAGHENTAVGYEALYLNLANGNTASGNQAMRQNIGGGGNAAFGYTALYSNTIGGYNVAAGAQALAGNTEGSVNVAIGAGAIDANGTGSYNTVLGGFAGRYFTDGLSTVDFGEPANGPHMNSKMDNSILIGAWAKPNNINQTNQIVIGYNASGNGSNTIQLGNTAITNVKTSGSISAGLGTSSFSGKVIVGASSAASSSAILEASSTTQGFLPPRMTRSQRNNITTPASGLVVWCNNCGAVGELQVYSENATWTNLSGTTAAGVYTPTIGEAYQGGKVAYVLQPGDPGYDATIPHGLIAATSDQSSGSGIRWNNGSYTTTAATGTAIGTGLANTNTIITSQGATSTSYAAGLARAYNGGGYNDWYLPSKDELNKLFINQLAIWGFQLGYYWSSSEFTNTSTWNQNLNGGYQNPYGGKDGINYVRAIRAF